MVFVIESECGIRHPERDAHRLHWIVKCVEKGKLVEMHRFFRSPEGFTYHRGNHGDQELAALRALEDHFEKHPESLPPRPVRIHKSKGR